MNAMERCAEHRLLRCAVCMHRQTKSAPTPAATSAAPGEILDGPMLPVESAPVDKQAQEAIERNKEIAAASQQPVKPFDPVGLDPLSDSETLKGLFHPNPPFQVRPRSTVEPNPIVAAASQQPVKPFDPIALDPLKNIDGGFYSEPPFVVQPRDTMKSNPIVAAAAEYTEAQKRVETAAQTIKRIRIELDDAENEQKEAVADRDVKKSVLQKLVAE